MKELRAIVGRSGTGKNYLAKVFGLKCVPSYTTRPIRNGEINGVEHIFIKPDEFQRYEKNTNIVAHQKLYGYDYFVTTDLLDNYDAMIIDPAGLKMLQENYTHREIIVILIVSSLFRRIINMYKRGDGIISILKRIYTDRKYFSEFEVSGKYNYTVRI